MKHSSEPLSNDVDRDAKHVFKSFVKMANRIRALDPMVIIVPSSLLRPGPGVFLCGFLGKSGCVQPPGHRSPLTAALLPPDDAKGGHQQPKPCALFALTIKCHSQQSNVCTHSSLEQASSHSRKQVECTREPSRPSLLHRAVLSNSLSHFSRLSASC